MNKKNKLSVISILLVGLALGGTAGINPVIQKIIETYPNVDVSYIYMVSTLPPLFCMLTSTLVGFVVGRKFHYKTSIVFGLIFYLIGGVTPVFLTMPFIALLALRAIFGIGLGFTICSSAAIMSIFNEEESAKYLGYFIFLVNVGAVLIQMGSGLLGDIKLSISYLMYFIAVIPFLMVLFFMKEPGHVNDSISGNVKILVKKANIAYILTMLTATMLTYPLLVNMASYIQQKGLGTATVTATILSIYSIAGAFGGAFFGKLYSFAKRYIASILFGSMSIGLLIVIYSSNIIMISIGTIFVGFGFFAVSPMLLTFTGIITDPVSIPFNASLITSGNMIGIFVSSYWISFIGNLFHGDVIIGSFVSGAVLLGAITIFVSIKDPRPKNNSLNNNQVHESA